MGDEIKTKTNCQPSAKTTASTTTTATTVSSLFKKLLDDAKDFTTEDKIFLLIITKEIPMFNDSDKTPVHPINFTESWQYSDIKFSVEGKHVHANRLILILWSPVFKAMFENNFIEKDAKEILLPGKTFDDFVELMKVLHPPNNELTESNVQQLLPLLQEYQIDSLLERAEEILCNQPSSVKNYLLAQKFNLAKLSESNLQYLKRAPTSRLKAQPDYEQLDQAFLNGLLMEKLEKFENHVENLREVRMVLERKKPTTFPGMHLLCEPCVGARDQQVDCQNCMKNCCHKLTNILRNMEA